MAVIAPNSEIYLIKCPIELDNLNQLSFANATAQHTYFNGLPKLSLTNATFQRKDGTIRWPGSMESIIEYNYCMYRNKNHGNKWFYAFIDDMRYENDNMTSIKISTDCWQTWQFDITFKASYVEREHTNDDSVGANTLPEGLDTGEYICNDLETINFAKRQYYSTESPAPSGSVMLCIQVTTLRAIGNGTDAHPTNPPTRNIVDGVPQGTYIIGIPYNKDALSAIYMITATYDAAGKKDAIVSMFLCPRDVTTWYVLQGSGFYNTGYVYAPTDSDAAYTTTGTTVYPTQTVDGYTPKNNKLFVSPYSYFHITNNAGTDIEFYYENFNGNPQFNLYGALDQGGSYCLMPTNSKKSTDLSSPGTYEGYPEAIMGQKLPQISWTSDYYLNWQAQNSKNLAIQTGLSALGFATNTLTAGLGGGFGNYNDINAAMGRINNMPTGPGTERRMQNALDQVQYIGGNNTGIGGMFGGMINFASQVANTQNAIRNAKMVPPQVSGNVSGGYLNFAMDECKFTVYQMSVREEYARCIDNYFSMFGYKTNKMKVPNITGRLNWNYVKTLGCNITGDIPQGDMQAIKAMFNNGVTIWHNSSTYLDYSQNNNIV